MPVTVRYIDGDPVTYDAATSASLEPYRVSRTTLSDLQDSRVITFEGIVQVARFQYDSAQCSIGRQRRG